MSYGKKTNLWEILASGGIVIPNFQRDYAQGRDGKEDLRKRFLNEIKDAVQNQKPLMLDFVYGVKRPDGKMMPLDGQQRLTTLWLVMWYALYRDYCSYSQTQRAWEDRMKALCNFSYETRSSSTDFMRWLCTGFFDGFETQETIKEENEPEYNLSGIIQQRSGFHAVWRQDPTVQSVLRMLSGTYKKQGDKKVWRGDGIEQVFKDVDLHALFVVTEYPVQFYHLDLEGIKESDNLYIKMNARGEQLTGFENFKADLVGNFKKDSVLSKYVTLNDSDYILTRWDVVWTDLFWKKRAGKSKIDNLFFAFVKRLLLDCSILNLMENNSREVDPQYDILKCNFIDNEEKEYSSFEYYEKYMPEVMPLLVKSLDGICSMIEDSKKDPETGFETVMEILPSYDLQDKDDEYKVKAITFQERVMFYGIAMFAAHYSSLSADSSKVYRHWCRVLWNLVYYNEITSFDTFKTRLKFVDSVVKELVGTDGFVDIYSDDAVSKLEKLPNTYKTKIGELLQLDEELKKIQLINGNNCSEEVLSKLEKLWIFQGNIGCLLNCDGIILDDSLAQIISHMIGSERSQYLRNIEGNMGNVLSMFRAVLAVSEHDTLPEELLLNDEHNRFRILLNGSLMDPFRTMLEKLRGLCDSAGSYSPEQERYSADIVGNNVRSIIDSIGENVPYWIYALVKIPELWNMSERGKIKKEHREGNEGYYLYRKVRMNENDIFLEKDNVKSLLSL